MNTREDKIKALLTGDRMEIAKVSNQPLPKVQSFYNVQHSGIYLNEAGDQVHKENIPKNRGGIISSIIVTYPIGTDLQALLSERSIATKLSSASRIPI